MRMITMLAALMLLAGCESAEHKQARWNADLESCHQHDFTYKQCELIVADRWQAKSDAEDNAAMAGAAIGLAAGRR